MARLPTRTRGTMFGSPLNMNTVDDSRRIKYARKVGNPKRNPRNIKSSMSASQIGASVKKVQASRGKMTSKAVLGAAGLGIAANMYRNRTGPAADRPSGRPTGPYMY